MYATYKYGGQILLLGFWLFLALGASLLAYFSWDIPMAGSVALNRVFKASLIFWPIIFSIITVPLEIDGIWEKGISARKFMVTRLMRRSFLEYGQITLVQIDKMNRGPYRWKRLTLKDQRNRITLHFGDQEHTNGFYEELFRFLEKRCPGARWMERTVFITKWEREVTRMPPSE